MRNHRIMMNTTSRDNFTIEFAEGWPGGNDTGRGFTTDPWTPGTLSRTGSTSDTPVIDEADDAIWILSSTFIIFTMQSGFGLLESGSVTTKNEVNIMIKNAADVIFGGLSYWMFGYSFSFGEGRYRNAFNGWGHWFVAVEEHEIGKVYAKFFFQSSFATTATTIVSGAMAERTKLESYIIFSFLNTLVFCFPAHWVWDHYGWLYRLGVVDIAGAGPVHLVGGVTGLVATMMLKPRHGRYHSKYPPPMGSPTNALLGMFMLWWGWLGFNCGSTFGISGYKWKLAARSAVATLIASIGGGCMGMLLRSALATLVAAVGGGAVTFGISFIVKRRKFDVAYIINGILGALVGITGFCALADPWESMVIGIVGSVCSLAGVELLDKLKIDDPVGVVGVHGVAGVWSMLAVGLFAKEDSLGKEIGYEHVHGAFYGGGFYLLGIQLLASVVLIVWTAVVSFILLKIIDLTLGIRVPLQQEILGADLVEHAVGDIAYDKAKGRVVAIHKPNSKLSTLRVDEDIPKFNEARKRRRSTKTDTSLESIIQVATMTITDDNHNGQVPMTNGYGRKSDPEREELSRHYKTMWKFAVGKSLNADERTKRKKVERNFSKLYRNHAKLKNRNESSTFEITDVAEESEPSPQEASLNGSLTTDNQGFVDGDETIETDSGNNSIDNASGWVNVTFSEEGCGTGVIHQEKRQSPALGPPYVPKNNMDITSTYI